MRRTLLVALAAGLALSAGCGTKPESTATGERTSVPPAQAGAGKVTTTSAPKAPTTTAKNSAECTRYRSFRFAYSGFVLSKADAKPAALKTLETTGADLKKAAADQSASVDKILAAAKRAADGKPAADDKNETDSATKALESWFKTTCLNG